MSIRRSCRVLRCVPILIVITMTACSHEELIDLQIGDAPSNVGVGSVGLVGAVVTNRSQHAMRVASIMEVDVGCACHVDAPLPFDILAGETVQVDLTLRPQQRSGEYETYLQAFTDDFQKSNIVTLRWTVTAQVPVLEKRRIWIGGADNVAALAGELRILNPEPQRGWSIVAVTARGAVMDAVYDRDAELIRYRVDRSTAWEDAARGRAGSIVVTYENEVGTADVDVEVAGVAERAELAVAG